MAANDTVAHWHTAVAWHDWQCHWNWKYTTHNFAS